MSLDITLSEIKSTCCPHCEKEISTETVDVFDANITNNLTAMADAAKLYDCLWQPQQVGIKKAEQLIEPLKNAIKEMTDTPSAFKKFDSDNGWGTLEDFLPWLKKLLEACENHPEAFIDSWS